MVLLPDCNQSSKVQPDNRPADEAAIRTADSAWSVATGSKNMKDFLGYMADDGIIQAPNAPLAKGKDSVQKLMAGFFSVPGFFVKWTASKAEAAASGDLGYSMGAYHLTFNDDKGKMITDNGKYTTIWKKQADGSWKVAVDMFNSDLPAQP